MINSSGIIVAPINAADPYRAMGLGQYNGWWDVKYACSNIHNKINPYSRFKPTVVDDVPIIDLTADNVKRANFSLVLTDESSAENLYLAIVTNGEEPIKYYIPGWGRLTDFINYNHNAEMTVKPLGYREIKKGLATQGKDYKTHIIPPTPQATTYQIGYEEMYEHINEGTSQIDELHHGVLLINGSSKYWCTDFVNWKQDPIKNWTGDIQVFQFITNVQKNTDNGDVHNPDYFDWFAAIPSNEANPNPFTWKVTNEFPEGSLEYYFSGTVPAREIAGEYHLEYTVLMSAVGEAYRGGSARTIYVQLMDGTTPLEYRDIADSYTIAKGQEKRWTGTFNTTIQPSQLMKLRMVISANNEQQYVARPIIQE